MRRNEWKVELRDEVEEMSAAFVIRINLVRLKDKHFARLCEGIIYLARSRFHVRDRLQYFLTCECDDEAENVGVA